MRLGQRPGSSLAVAASLALTLSACGNNTENNAPQPTPIDMSRDLGGDMMALVDMPVETDQGNPSDLGSDMGTDMSAEDMTQSDMETDMSAPLDCVDTTVVCAAFPSTLEEFQPLIDRSENNESDILNQDPTCARAIRDAKFCVESRYPEECSIRLDSDLKECLYTICASEVESIHTDLQNSGKPACTEGFGTVVLSSGSNTIHLSSLGREVNVTSKDTVNINGQDITVATVMPIRTNDLSNPLGFNAQTSPVDQFVICDGQNCTVKVDFLEENISGGTLQITTAGCASAPSFSINGELQSEGQIYPFFPETQILKSAVTGDMIVNISNVNCRVNPRIYTPAGVVLAQYNLDNLANLSFNTTIE